MVGDVVRVPFQFTNLQGRKVRPVLVIADVRSSGQDDWIVCEITSSAATLDRAIPVRQDDMQLGGLDRDSVARPDRMMTLNEDVFQGVMGQVTAAKRAEVLAAVRALFSP